MARRNRALPECLVVASIGRFLVTHRFLRMRLNKTEGALLIVAEEHKDVWEDTSLLNM